MGVLELNIEICTTVHVFLDAVKIDPLCPVCKNMAIHIPIPSVLPRYGEF